MPYRADRGSIQVRLLDYLQRSPQLIGSQSTSYSQQIHTRQLPIQKLKRLRSKRLHGFLNQVFALAGYLLTTQLCLADYLF